MTAKKIFSNFLLNRQLPVCMCIDDYLEFRRCLVKTVWLHKYFTFS